MLIYNSIEEINRAEAIVAVEQGKPSPGGWGEADWGYRLRGEGLRGGEHGWLLTFIFYGAPFSPDPNRVGTLIAYEIKNNSKTGRVAVVRRDWSGAADDEWMKKIKSSTQWSFKGRDSKGEADLAIIDEMLPGLKL